MKEKIEQKDAQTLQNKQQYNNIEDWLNERDPDDAFENLINTML
jgi:hypothetical protein